jgi:hypothetical protein
MDMVLFESPVEAAEAADEAVRRRLGRRVLGTYLHGSAVLGGFVPGRSDTDVLVVVADDVDRTALTPAVDELSVNGGCRGTGIELSIVTAEAARTSSEPWPFLVHVVTGSAATRVVWGSELPGDRDLLMHTAVVRAAGVAISGPPPEQTFGPVDRPAVLAYLVDELHEAVECATPTYTVLNACRAYRFLVTGDLVSKLDGAAWARGQAVGCAVRPGDRCGRRAPARRLERCTARRRGAPAGADGRRSHQRRHGRGATARNLIVRGPAPADDQPIGSPGVSGGRPVGDVRRHPPAPPRRRATRARSPQGSTASPR